MTTDDMDALRSLLTDLTPEELYSLENDDLTWLPQLRNLPQHTVLGVIFGAVQNVEPLEYRLWCIAFLRCQLMPLKRVKQWQLYRFDKSPTWSDCFQLVERTPTDLHLTGYDATIAWSVCGSALHGCLLIHDLQCPSMGRIPVYVVLWPGQPLLAVHSPECGIQLHVTLAVSAALHCGFMELPGLISEDLDSAYHVAVYLIQSS
ncbi:hypothetical protein V5799_017574 [Amblyomma americanum]|uniref:Uncharacterized protein n=1 Tax=Amblyomma americanum TaxID=6943 RepID=A0AAQ4F1W4_AMBAM